MNILCVTDMREGYPMRQRNDALIDIGMSVKSIDYTKNQKGTGLMRYWGRILYWLFRNNLFNFRMSDLSNTNKRIIEECKKREWDLLWLDRALMIEKSTLLTVKQNQP